MKIVQAACVISLALLTSAVQSEELSISDLPPTRTFDSTPKLAFGQVIRYGNKTVFSPCRDPSFTNFEDASSDGRIGKALDKLGLSAGKKLYVEVLGIREGDALKATDMNFAQTDGRCQMQRQLCYDTMADAVFGWTASVTANGETLKGCAWQR